MFQRTEVIHGTGRSTSLIQLEREASLQMTVEMNHADGTVFTVYAPQKRQSDGVITTQSDHAGKSLASLRIAFRLGIRMRRTRQDRIVALFHLLDGIRIVVPAARDRCISEQRRWLCRKDNPSRSHGDIPTVNDLGPVVEGVRIEGDVVAAAETNFS